MKHQIIKALCLSAVLTFTAFPVYAEESTQAVTEKEASDLEDLKELGKKETETDYQPVIKNSTGKDIKSVEIQVNSEEFGENLLEKEDVFKVEEERVLYCTPAEFDPNKGNIPKYNIRLTFADDTSAVIHTFPFGDADEVEFCLEDDVAYLTFHSLSLDSDQNTLNHELPAPDYYYDDSSADYNYSPSSNGGGGGGNGGGNECLTGGLMF